MTDYERTVKVERALRDFFHSEGWEIDISTAYQTFEDDEDEIGEVSIDLAALSQHLIREGIVK